MSLCNRGRPAPLRCALLLAALLTGAAGAQEPSKAPSATVPSPTTPSSSSPEKGTSTPPAIEQAQATNSYGGIGVMIAIEQGIARIVSTVENRPAAKAGLQPGDYVTHINKAIVIGLSRNEISEKLRGIPNTQVTLSVLRKGHDEPIEVKLVRETITIAPANKVSVTTPLNELTGLQRELAELAQGQMKRLVLHREPVPLPEFTYSDDKGATRSLMDAKGKITVLNIWATWCAPCLSEMPSINRLKARLGGPALEVIALSVDKSGIERPRKFLRDIQANALEVFNNPDSKLPGLLKIDAYPTTIIIGRDGREIGRIAGALEWDAEEVTKLLEAAAKPAS
ncbi:MAG: redoxin domain-containing protein [Hyphomicrobiaceae bacterium]|nr:MAG: redoxin domain-containing protein [Hyphomicrobiaceae bacterium]